MFRLATLVCAASALVVASTAAPAMGFSFLFDHRASNGVSVSYFIKSSGAAKATAIRGDRTGLQATTYEVRARTVTRKRIVADFGRFGQVDVRYQDAPGRPSCRDFEDAGSVQGTISFRGEGDYARLSADRAPATRSPYMCAGRRAGGSLTRGATLDALLLSCRPEEGLRYVAFAEGDDVIHDAALYEGTKRIRIARHVQYFGGPASFVRTKDSAAALAPKGFFSGSAEYDADLLTGDLEASFLGIADPVGLTPADAGLQIHGDGRFPSACRGLGR